jgi:hypothetical protein
MCMLVSGLSALRKVQLCGRWCLHAFYGVYGGKGMTRVLREDNGGDYVFVLRNFLSLDFCLCVSLS